MNCTYVFNKMLDYFVDPNIRGIASKGGTRSSKTWSVLQLLYLVARESPASPTRYPPSSEECSVTSRTCC